MASSPPASAVDSHHARRWLVLVVLSVAQLMVVLDVTIVNIALPSAQADLGFSDGLRPWIITAYALAFGSLLLLGGRLGDLLGRKRMFVTGLVGFAVAAVVGGAAESFGVLVAARTLQGVSGAILAPAALSLLTTTFTDPAERGTAFGVFAAIAGAGAGVGLLLGGVLTETLSWRWCMYVNLAFAVPALIGALVLLRRDERAAERQRLDLPGTVTVTAGLFALVYGVHHAESHGWGSTLTVALLIAAVVLIGAFVALQQRVAHPLLPLRVVADRDRGASYLALGVGSMGIFGISLFLTYFMQRSLGFSPIQTGLAFLPMNAAIMASVGISSALLPRIGPRHVLSGGLVLAAVAMALLTQLEHSSAYASAVLPALIVFGLGYGALFGAGLPTASAGVQERDAGVSSAMINTSQEIGGAVGLAVLASFFATAATNYAADNPGRADLELVAAAHGYTTAFWWATGILTVFAVVCAVMLRPGVSDEIADAAAAPVAH